MIFINLMPHRHRRLALRRRRFATGLGVTVMITILLVLAASFGLERLQAQQRSRNAVLEQAKLKQDQQEARVRALQREVVALELRQATVAGLQQQRNVPVGLFNELARLTPPGVVLTGVRQNDLRLAITGMAASNERVSDFMALLQTEATMLQAPELVEMRSMAPTRSARAPGATGGLPVDPEASAERMVDFTLNVAVRRELLTGEARP